MRTPLHSSALLFVALASATCATGPIDPERGRAPAARLLVCTAADAPAGSVKEVVGPESGRVELDIVGPRGRHRLTIPPGAVTEQTTFILSAKASETVEVEAHAEGHTTFAFANGRRATLRLDAEHCPAAFDRLERRQIFRREANGLVPVGGSTIGIGPLRKAALKTELPTLSGYALGGS
ncbi:MAG: hypothetical protein AVDCRST_MAG68-74 [uncultured Gemmatimonadetes bacterium]|uniref:Uncharacterized protein n=1 Tax=uncultured Gemmatimonadota bacterium TaxID=203437 RepID=A0A6J4K6T7_9BACT|nr:MAG: hypothetical protein AVDCRST_MAG68-74 [uncultured Gemmatimonadota bacterium]